MPPDTQPNDLGLTWIRIADFSPGIQQRTMYTGAPTSPAQQQSAATMNTFRCVALPNGGLGPLPSVGQKYQPAVPDTHTSTNTYSGYACVGFFVISFVDDGSHSTFMEWHIAYEWINNFGGAQRRFQWERHRVFGAGGFGGPPVIDVLKRINSADPNTTGQFNRCWFAQTRMDPTTATNPGIPVVTAAWYAAGGLNEKFWSVFPNPATPAVNLPVAGQNVLDISTTLAVDNMISHQNRSLVAVFQGYGHPNASWAGNDNYWWTNANLPSIQPTVAQVFGSDTYSGTSDMASTNASQLFIIKPMRGGAVIVSGDVANPTVQIMPGMNVGSYPSVQGSYCGYGYIFFALNSGAYMWSGGDQAAPMAPQLEENFFIAAFDPRAQGGTTAVNDHMINSQGASINWGDYIAVPNNWLFDARTQNWWRLEDPQVFQAVWFQNSMYTPFQGWLWGASNFYDGTAPLVQGWDPQTPVSDYQWESQPIEATQAQLCNTRMVLITAQGEGQVKVILKGLNDAEETTIFDIPAGDVPTQLMANSNLKAQRIQIFLHVTATAPNPAPIIYDAGFAFSYVEQIPSQ